MNDWIQENPKSEIVSKTKNAFASLANSSVDCSSLPLFFTRLSRRKALKIAARLVVAAGGVGILYKTGEAAGIINNANATPVPKILAIPIPPVQPTVDPNHEAVQPQPATFADDTIADRNTRENVMSNAKTIAPEAKFYSVRITNMLNNPPETIKSEEIPVPPDFGTAYLLALYGDPKWQRVFFENLLRDDLQNSSRYTPDGRSYWDFNTLSEKGFNDDVHVIITKNPVNNETTIETIKYQKNIELPDGIKIGGIKVFDSDAKGVGLLSKIWLTSAPVEKERNIFDIVTLGVKEYRFAADLLARSIGEICIVIDNREVKRYKVEDLFSGSKPLARIENGGYIFEPLLRYKNAKVYLTPPANQSPEQHGLWWKVEGHDFKNEILNQIPNPNLQESARSQFLAWWSNRKNTVLEQNMLPIKERKLIKDFWSEDVEEDGTTGLSFRVRNLTDLANVTFKIDYPNDEKVPATSVTLQQMVGMLRKDTAFSNRIFTMRPDQNGGVQFTMNENLQLPKGTRLKVQTINNTEIELTLRQNTEKIGKLRFGIFSQTKERAESKNGQQDFDPPTKDFNGVFSSFYLDDPVVDINAFNSNYVTFPSPPPAFERGYLEGNIFILQTDGKMRSVCSGWEDHADNGFYEQKGNTFHWFMFGIGKYIKTIINNRLISVNYDKKDQMYAYVANVTPIRLAKGERLIIRPGEALYETARVQTTLFGYYKAD